MKICSNFPRLTLADTDTHPGLTQTPQTHTNASELKSEIMFDPSVAMEEDFREEREQEIVNVPDTSNEWRLPLHSADRGKFRIRNFGK